MYNSDWTNFLMLENLPFDVSLLVLQHLPFNEMIRVGRVNKYWSNLVFEPVLYEELTFQGLNEKNNLTGSQLTELVVNKLLPVEFVSILDMSEIMSEKITGNQKKLKKKKN